MWLIFAFALAAETSANAWREAFISRIAVIETAFGIPFNEGWIPEVAFGIPDYIHPALRARFGAAYEPETMSFIVAPYQRDYRSESLIDHELGHALADQVSRRIGNGPWPDMVLWKTMTFEEHSAFKVISERIGGYFSGPDSNAVEEWLPAGFDDLSW